MSKVQMFEDLEAWKEARSLVKAVYSSTSQGAFSRDFGLRDQVQRAAISIMSNIAEGFERGSNKEFIQFLYVAKGSSGELRSQLYAALDLGYLDKHHFDELRDTTASISRRISNLIKYLKSSPFQGEKRK